MKDASACLWMYRFYDAGRTPPSDRCFRRIFGEWFPRLRERGIRWRRLQEDDAEECAQQALLNVSNTRTRPDARFDERVARFSTWIQSIHDNVISGGRRGHREVAMPALGSAGEDDQPAEEVFAPPDFSDEELHDAEDDHEEILTLINRLSFEDRELLYIELQFPVKFGGEASLADLALLFERVPTVADLAELLTGRKAADVEALAERVLGSRMSLADLTLRYLRQKLREKAEGQKQKRAVHSLLIDEALRGPGAGGDPLAGALEQIFGIAVTVEQFEFVFGRETELRILNAEFGSKDDAAAMAGRLLALPLADAMRRLERASTPPLSEPTMSRRRNDVYKRLRGMIEERL